MALKVYIVSTMWMIVNQIHAWTKQHALISSTVTNAYVKKALKEIIVKKLMKMFATWTEMIITGR